MELSIVISRGEDADEGSIYTRSPVKDIITFLRLLGYDRWEFCSKGYVYLQAEKDDVYIAVGPTRSGDKEKFLSEASGLYSVST